MAGPGSSAPGRSPPRGTRSTSAQPPAVNIGTRAAPAAARPGAPAGPPAAGSGAAVSSTDTASSTTGLSGIRKENCCRYAASNALTSPGRPVSGTVSAVSVPAYRRCARRVD